MTQGSGHPDWQSYAQWRSGALIDVTQSLAPGVTWTSPMITVSNWETLLVIAEATTKGAHMLMYTAPSVDTPLAEWTPQQAWELPAGSNRLHAQLTPLDRAVLFTASDADAVTAATLALSVYGLNVPSVPGGVRFSDNMDGLNSFSLAAGASQAFLLPVQGVTRAGVYAWTPLATVNGMTLTLATVNAAGTVVQRLGRWDNVKGAVVQQVTVPTDPLQLTLTNFTGGTVSTIDLALTGAY